MGSRVFFFISFLITCTGFGQELWVNPAGTDVKTVFYQGMNSSQTQGAKYTGSRGFIGTTGEIIVNKRAIDVIQNIYIKPEIDEVKPLTCFWPYGADFLDVRSLLLFMQQSIYSVPTAYANYSYGTEVIQWNPHQKESIKGHLLDMSKINIGQHGDYNNHKKRFDLCRSEYPDSGIICYGVSRGSATTFGSLAKMNQEGTDLSAVKLCILEGCFDTVPHVLELRYGKKLGALCASIFTKLTAFKLDGPSPLGLVEHFPQTIPVAFITSKQDKEVPEICTKTLVNALKNAGHRDIYLLELERSSHPSYMFDDETDRDTYQNFMHALYAQYNLPHSAEYAERGYDLVIKSKI